jgi:hypothetical protein
LLILKIKWPLKYYAVPFVVDFKELDDELEFKINAPAGIQAQVIAEQMDEGVIEAFPQVKSIKALRVAPGEPQNLNLVIENVGAEYKPGDIFDVSVSAFKGDKEVSNFMVQFQVEE